ncbi:MAG: nucleoside kinase, partial [Clostridiales bacterium]|nr:nucleoside kinase [Clostridiales bacterium]
MDHDFKIRTFTDERAYHNTAILVYLKAAKAVLGDVDVTIGNSLNQGYYSYINKKGGAQLTPSDLHKIRDAMDRFIAQDLEVVIEKDNVAHAIEKWYSLGYPEKARLLTGRPSDETIEIVNLHNYRNCMYTVMLPSAGYINLYEIRPYRNGLLLRLPNALHDHSIPPYRDDDKLYEAYAQCRRMRKYTGIEYLADMNDRIREGKADDVIRESEWLQSRQLEEFAENVVEERKRVVLIAGPSSSGKTTTAKRICKEIGRLAGQDPLYLGTDDYFVERGMTPLGPDGKPDFEGLGAVDLPLFNRQM